MAIIVKYSAPSYKSYGKDELNGVAHICCAKGSIGAQCKGAAIGTTCVAKSGILCSGIGGIGISCDSEQTGAVCTNGMVSFSCENSAQSSPETDNEVTREVLPTKNKK